MISKAHDKDMLTTPYVFSESRPMRWRLRAPTSSSALGLTTGGAIGAHTALKLEDCPEQIDTWAAAALCVNPDIWCWPMASRSPA